MGVKVIAAPKIKIFEAGFLPRMMMAQFSIEMKLQQLVTKGLKSVRGWVWVTRKSVTDSH